MGVPTIVEGLRGVRLGMSTIHPEYPDAAPSGLWPADAFLRQEPNEEEDEEEDDGKKNDDDADEDEGYSE